MISYQLGQRAAAHPHALALIYGRTRRTYAQLYERACRLASGLLALGVVRGDRIAVVLHNGPQFIEALFAAAKIGAIFVPLNFRLQAAELARQIASLDPRVLMASTQLKDRLLQPGPACALLWIDDGEAVDPDETPDDYETWLQKHSPEDFHTDVHPDEALMLGHSSGTTSLPKSIIYSHAGAIASCAAKIIDFQLHADDTAVVFGPLFHVGPLYDLTLPLLLRGGRVVLGASRNFDPARLLDTLAAHRGTVLPIYPTMLRRLVAAPATEELDLSALRLILTGGEAAPPALIQSVHRRFPGAEFINNYGSTEGGPVTTFLPAQEGVRKIGSVGRESFSVEVRIADAEGRPLSAGEVGEILVRSPFVCRGYWDQPEATAASLRNGWWHTGDLGWRDEEGFLWIAGRSKDLVKSGGEAIHPLEVENALADLSGIEEVAVIGVPDEEWGEVPAAFIVQRSDATLTGPEIASLCEARLASFKHPRYLVFLDALPRGPTNKVLKNALRSRWAQGEFTHDLQTLR